MHVVIISTNTNRAAIQRFTNTADVIPQFLFDGFVDGWTAVLGAERDVHVDFCEGLGHGVFFFEW